MPTLHRECVLPHSLINDIEQHSDGLFCFTKATNSCRLLMALIEYMIGIFLITVELKTVTHDQYLEVEILEV